MGSYITTWEFKIYHKLEKLHSSLLKHLSKNSVKINMKCFIFLKLGENILTNFISIDN